LGLSLFSNMPWTTILLTPFPHVYGIICINNHTCLCFEIGCHQVFSHSDLKPIILPLLSPNHWKYRHLPQLLQIRSLLIMVAWNIF
jgi:hypothetical protein